MVRRKATSVDVAREAGVSQSAVSRSFTPGASVAEETRERVLAAADRLGYRPNAIARSLITRRSQIIAVAVSYLHNQFYPELVQGLSAAAQARGYHILLFTSGEGKAADRELMRCLDYQIDGLVLASVSLSSEIASQCMQAGIPVVMVNRVSDEPTASKVTGANLEGGRQIAHFLVAGGHKRIAYLSGIEGTSTNRDRYAGFRRGLQEAGARLHGHAVGDYDSAKAAHAAETLMNSAEPPDAIFCANDHMALGVMEHLRAGLGLRIPQDVSIVGFDDVRAAGWPSYSLTTFSQSVDAMTEATSMALFRAIDAAVEGERLPPVHIELSGELLVRGSARVPAGFVGRTWSVNENVPA
ncbi:MAG: LacI family DNA-binding transcriptional regulator [Pseudomonadota bacterium]